MKFLIGVVLVFTLACKSEPPPAPKEKPKPPEPVLHPVSERDLPIGTDARFLIDNGRCYQITDSDFQFCVSADPPPRKKVKKSKRIRRVLGNRERVPDKIIAMVSKDAVHVWPAYARSLPSSKGIQAKFLVQDPQHETSFMVGSNRGTLTCVKSVYKMEPIDKPATEFLSGRNFFVPKPREEPTLWKSEDGGEYALIETLSVLGPTIPLLRYRIGDEWESVELRAKSQTEFNGPNGEKLEIIDDGTAVFTNDKKATILAVHDDPATFKKVIHPESDPEAMPPCAVLFKVPFGI